MKDLNSSFIESKMGKVPIPLPYYLSLLLGNTVGIC